MTGGSRLRRSQGFTLIEAVVAMVLIGGIGMALAGWLNANLATLSRIQEANARSDAMANILEYMEKINPMQTPHGQADMGSYRIVWQAKEKTAPMDGVGYPRGVSLYQIALYTTEVMVNGNNGQRWFDIRLQQIGYKQIRTLGTDW